MVLLLLYSAIILIYYWISLNNFFYFNRQCARLSWLAFIFAILNIFWEYIFPEYSFLCRECAVMLAFAGSFIFSTNENVWDTEGVVPFYEKPKVDEYLFPAGIVMAFITSFCLFENHWVGFLLGMVLSMAPVYVGLATGSSILMHNKYKNQKPKLYF